jgi:ubiquitin-conjugating enzyme E2 O
LSPASLSYISDELGVHRGEFVLIHSEGTTNGLKSPRVPKIGEVEAWAREPLTEVDGIPCGWRKDLIDIGARLAAERAPRDEANPKQSIANIDAMQWFGEVTDVSNSDSSQSLLSNNIIAGTFGWNGRSNVPQYERRNLPS